MCIFCGGTCGGVGDMLLPSLVTGASLLVMRIRVNRANHDCDDDGATAFELSPEPTEESVRESSAVVVGLPVRNPES